MSVSYRHRSCPSPRDPAIRHAGRAHIRGKIRRVWRPRYLELCDSGLVRYYELPSTADVTLPEDSDWDHVNMIPKDTLVIYHARIIDVTTLRDLHVGLPRGSFGFLFRGQRQMTNENLLLLTHPPEPNPPREYFCAVSTLEEAQTWVIALQWASSVSEAHQHRPSVSNSYDCHHIPHQVSIPKSSAVSAAAVVGEDSIITTETEDKSTDHRLPVPLPLPLPLPLPPPPSAADNSNSNSNDHSNFPPKRLGRIVVTKVRGYRLVKHPTQVLQWQVAYEIALLLLQGNKVEERRILRTAQDLQLLLDQLLKEVDDSKISSQAVLEEWRPQLEAQLLPKLANATPQQLEQSFALVNDMLRALAMEAAIVNSYAMKRCFVLDWDDPPVQRPQLWKPLAKNALIYSARRSIPGETDDFVKHWLGHKTKHMEPPVLLWTLQRPWMVAGGAGLALALLVPILRIYQRVMVSFTIRLDVLIVTWCAAAYLGKRHGPQQFSSQPARPVPRPKRLKHHPPSGIIGNSNDDNDNDNNNNNNINQVVDLSMAEDAETNSDESAADCDDLDYLEDETEAKESISKLSSPLPQYPSNNGESCWSVPPENNIFRVRGSNYLEDRIKIPSGPSPFVCRGVDVWLTDNPERHIARHPSVMGGQLAQLDTFLVNFLLPFGNFVSYFTIPPLSEFPDKLANVWTKFVQGDQQYRDARLKLLPVVIDGPWIVKAAVGNGTAPALLGKVIPLQYFFKEPEGENKGVYEVDVIITASSIAKGILSVVKGHTKSLTIGFAFIIEAAEQEELPETVLCAFQVHALHLEDCPHLPECNLDEL